jgi:hypothetical protein
LDYEYLTIQTLRAREISDWAASFVQCSVPEVWSSAYQDYYITELQLILCGSKLYNHEMKKTGGGDIMQTEIELGSSFLEDDYMILIDQLDIAVFLNRLLQEHKEMHNGSGTLFQRGISERLELRLLATVRCFFDIILHGLQRLKGFSSVSKRLSQLLCQLSQILGDYLLVLGPMEYNKQNIESNHQLISGR